MRKAPLFSVIMNCRNSAKYLKAAIDSVYAQTLGDWEIVFFDNQSTDQSAAIAKSYDERVNYVWAEVPLALGEARNEAMRRASGEYVTFLDCDDLWAPEKLAEQKKIFDRHPDVDFAFSEYTNWFEQNQTRQPAVGLKKAAEGDLFRRELARYRVGILTVAFRRSLLDKLTQWFDSSLNLTEDYDLFLRLLYAGKSYYSPFTAGDYRVHSHNLSRVLQTKWAEEMSLVYAKLNAQIPDFEKRYAKETNALRAKIAYLFARTHIAQGENAAARVALKPFRFQNPLYFSLYLLGFAPPSLWTRFYQGYRQLRYGITES